MKSGRQELGGVAEPKYFLFICGRFDLRGQEGDGGREQHLNSHNRHLKPQIQFICKLEKQLSTSLCFKMIV
jgi:hypothetical protein